MSGLPLCQLKNVSHIAGFIFNRLHDKKSGVVLIRNRGNSFSSCKRIFWFSLTTKNTLVLKSGGKSVHWRLPGRLLVKKSDKKTTCHYSGGSLSAPRTVYSERNILEWIAKKVLCGLKNNSTLSITLFSSFIFLKTFCGIKHASTYRISFCKWTIKGVIHEISDKVLINASPPAIHLLNLFQLFIYLFFVQ